MPTTFNNVDSEAELRDAIFTISNDHVNEIGNGPFTINITGHITLTQSLPMITTSVAITGNGTTLDANNAGRAFFVQSGTVAISNLTINNAVAQGGAGGTAGGGGGGGGGLGAGAAVFVNSGAAASLTNVTVGNASATAPGTISSSSSASRQQPPHQPRHHEADPQRDERQQGEEQRHVRPGACVVVAKFEESHSDRRSDQDHRDDPRQHRHAEGEEPDEPDEAPLPFFHHAPRIPSVRLPS